MILTKQLSSRQHIGYLRWGLVESHFGHPLLKVLLAFES